MAKNHHANLVSGEGDKKKQQLPLQPLQDPPTSYAPVPPTQPLLPSHTHPRPQNVLRLDDDDDDELMSGDEQFEDASKAVESSPFCGGELYPLAPPQQLAGSSTHQIQLMKASFFRKVDDPQPSPSKTSLFPLAPPGSPSSCFTDRTPVSRYVSIRHTHLPYSLAPGSVHPSTPHHIPSASTSLAQSAVLMSKRDLRRIVPGKDSTCAGYQRSLCDHGLFLGRSFRVGWGPNWTMVHSGVQLSSLSVSEVLGTGGQGGMFVRSFPHQMGRGKEGHPIRVVVEHLGFNTVSKDCDSFELYLKAQLEHTEFQDRAPLCAPLCSPVQGTSLLHALSDVALTHSLFPSSSSLGSKEEAGELTTHRQLDRVLQLLVVLWGDLPSHSDTDKEGYAHQLARRQRVRGWLKDTNKLITDKEVSAASESDEQYLEHLFSLVAGQQLGAACSLAQQKKDHKLALLLSQATFSTKMNKLFLRKQLEMWEQLGAHRHMHRVRLKLYVLLAGVMKWDWKEETRTMKCLKWQALETNTSVGLDWKRSLALHLCFGSNLNSHIVDVLGKYTDAFQGAEPPYACPPYPPHVECLPTRPTCTDSVSFDTCYHLLCLYCQRDYSMELTLQPSASSPHPLDYRTSWLVWSVLTAQDYTHIRGTTEAQLLVGLANQVARCGKWQWSIFALLHLKDSVLCRNAVEEVLAQNCSPEEELVESEVFVVERLRVPKEWVYHAKAQRAGYEDWHDLRAAHLLLSCQWNEAHLEIVNHLAVDAIITGEIDELLQMLKKLEPHASHIQCWDNGGSVFLDYLCISNRFHQLSASSSSHKPMSEFNLESLLEGLKLLAGRIRLLPADSPRKVLCQSELAKQTVNFTRALVQIKADSVEEPDRYIVNQMVSCLRQLPLPPDCANTEHRALIPLQMNTVFSHMADYVYT